jgi:predicted DsbA family dithiol-disulfide isomerase
VDKASVGEGDLPESAMRLDIFADVVCPWCWIGKRRLERALTERPQSGVAIRWRAFQLNPGMPPGGMDRREYLTAKFGNDTHATRVYDAVRSAGRAEGLAFDFERILRTPSTLDAHRLIRLAQEDGKGSRLIELLFRAYFSGGEDIGDRSVLLRLAGAARIETAKVRRLLDGVEGVDAVQSEDALARRHGINGVPCFIFNGKYALAGAHEPEVMFQLFDLAREDERAAEPAQPA